MTLVARLGADGPGVALDRVVGDVCGALALAAGDAHQVPLGAAQRAVQKPIALGPGLRAHDAGDRQRAAHRTQPRNFEPGHLIGEQATGERHPVHLQRGHQERRPSHVDRVGPPVEERVRLRLELFRSRGLQSLARNADSGRSFLRRAHRPAELRDQLTPVPGTRPATRVDHRHAVGMRPDELVRRGGRCVEGPDRQLLGVSHYGHQPQVIADGVAGRAGLRELPEAPAARREELSSIGQSNARNRPLSESLNLARFEDARHE